MSIQTDNIKLLHSSCFFNKCSRYGPGGAIYLNGQSSIIQHRFCTTETKITSKEDGLYSYSYTSNNYINLRNYVIECSVSRCSQPSAYSLIFMRKGNCGIFSSNFSKNTVYQYSGFQMFQIYRV